MGPRRCRRRGAPGVALLAAAAIALTACGGAAPVPQGAGGPSAAPRGAGPPVAAAPTSAAVPSPDPTVPVAAAQLPGAPAQLHTPFAALAVVDAAERGVALRALPGAAGDTLQTLWAGSNRITATGRAREVDDHVWVEVRVGPQEAVGWTRSRDVVRASVMQDVTDAVRTRLGGRVAPAADMVELGALVADSEAAYYPRTRVAQARPALLDRVGDVSFDIVVRGDPAIRGIRLRVIGAPTSQDRVELVAVERSLLCRRDATTPAGTCDLRCVGAPEQPRWQVHDEPPPAGT